MKLYQGLGLPGGIVEPGFYLKGLQSIEAVRGQDDNRYAYKRSVAMEYHALATAYYLHRDLVEARRWAAEVAPAMEEYFFGDWRRTTPRAGGLRDVAWWKEQALWVDEFAAGVCWGMCAGQWERVRRLAEYPDGRCARDASAPATSDATARSALYVAIAAFLQGRSEQMTASLRHGVVNSKRYAPLAECLSGVHSRDAQRVSEGLAQALRGHRTRAKRPKRLDMVCDMDSTILCHLARREGVGPAVPHDLADYLISL